MSPSRPRAVLTGGLGFIGFNFYQLYKDQFEWLVLDKRGYASNPVAEKAISELEVVDISQPSVRPLVEEFQPDYLFHFAAESHVDRSILDPLPFIQSNIVGTYQLLEAARSLLEKQQKEIKFIHVSTDEVYGALGPVGKFTENSPLLPNSPYSASKASSDLLVRAYHETFRLFTVTTRCSNNYGPWQFPEKLIPLMICQAWENRPLPVYGDGQHVRDWIFVDDHCRGIFLAASRGHAGSVYNFGSDSERNNLSLVKDILRLVDRPETLITFVADRKGHDRRYAIDNTLAKRELGWSPEMSLETGLEQTVQWYTEHRDWLDLVRSETYRAYCEKNYERRLPQQEVQGG